MPTTARITSVAFEYWAAVKAGVYPNDPPTRDHDDRSNLGDNSDLVAAAVRQLPIATVTAGAADGRAATKFSYSIA